VTWERLQRLVLLTLTVTAGGAAVPALTEAARHTAAPARAVGVTLDSGPGGEVQAYRLFLRAGANAIEAPQPWSAPSTAFASPMSTASFAVCARARRRGSC
jgi:hypothetical protein